MTLTEYLTPNCSYFIRLLLEEIKNDKKKWGNHLIYKAQYEVNIKGNKIIF